MVSTPTWVDVNALTTVLVRPVTCDVEMPATWVVVRAFTWVVDSKSALVVPNPATCAVLSTVISVVVRAFRLVLVRLPTWVVERFTT